MLGVIITPAGDIQKHGAVLGHPTATSAAAPQQSVLTPIPLLIDTGATSTCISSLLAQQLGLKPTGLRPVKGATSVDLKNKYLVDIGVPFTAGVAVPGTTVAAVTFVLPNIEVIEFIGRSPHFQGIR